MAVALSMLSLKVRASSWDTQQRLPYNRQRTVTRKPQNPNTTVSPPPSSSSSSATTTVVRTEGIVRVEELLVRKNPTPNEEKWGGIDTAYERWLPSPPKVEKPRSVYNAASLAYIGDCIYELYARKHFLFPPLNIEDYNVRVMAVVRCEAQDAMLQKLINDNALTDDERGVLRWGKNIGSAKTRTIKRAGVAVYNRASSLETLVGYLYLTNMNRLDEIMLKLGFSSGLSNQMTLQEETNT